MKSFSLIVVFCFFFGISFANSLPNDSIPTQKKYEQGEEYIEKGNFPAAIEIYESLIAESPEDPVLNFYLGYCYLNTTTHKDEATKYLQKAIDPSNGRQSPADDRVISVIVQNWKAIENVPIEASYFLGRAFHFNYKFKEAVDVYEDMLPRIPPREVEFIKMIEREIEICNYAIDITKDEIPMSIENLGEMINTEFSDHSPVVSADETLMIFSTLRSAGEDDDETTEDGQYIEKIYFSTKDENGDWTPARIVENVNDPEKNNASISLSTDGNQLYIYRDDKGNGNIYYSEKDGNTWSEPEKLGRNINSRSREAHAALSADGSTLIFSSNRKVGSVRILGMRFGGYRNGMDLYMAKRLPNGEWGEAEHLGDVINTEYDEDAPYIHPDGTLFFSSTGHKTMGGFDIFSAKSDENGGYAEPENIGYPINTTDDDIYYVLSSSGLRAYYASTQQNEVSQGRADIYLIGYSDDNIINGEALTGIVELCDDKPTDIVKITVTDRETDEITGIYTPHAETGKYVLILPPNKKFDVKYEADGYETIIDSIITDERQSYINLKKSVEIEKTLMCNPDFAGGALSINNILFDLDVYDKFQQPEAYNNLKAFAKFLKEHPTVTVEINGHACERGSGAYNIGLSKRRANFVKNYLVNEGVNADNLLIKAHGYNTPIGINKNADGSFREESMRFNRRVEFRIVEAAGNNISVIQVPIPNEYKVQR